MPIKNKDGTEYRLRGPNPIMMNQEIWPQERCKLINMVFQEEIVTDKNTTTKAPVKQIVKEEIEIVEPNLVVFQPPIVKSVEPEVPKIAQAPQKPLPEPKTSNLSFTSMHCLPIVFREVEDDVYGEKYRVQEFGKKFFFQGVIISEEDIFCQFWTKTKLTEKSIVYPQNQSRRWWEVESVEIKEDGYLIFAIPTQTNPDFTD